MPCCIVQSLYPLRKFAKRLCLFQQFVNHSVDCAVRNSDCSDSSDDNTFNEPSSSHYCDYSIIHGKMREYAKMGCVGKALEVLNSMRNIGARPSVKDYNALIYSYLKSSTVNFGELVQLHRHMKEFGPCPNALTYVSLLNGMLSLNCLRDALWIVDEMCRSGYVPSFASLSKLLKRLLRVVNLSDSRYVVELMLEFDYMPTESMLSTLILKFCQVDLIHEAYSVFSAFLCQVSFCSAPVYNPILWALCKSNQSLVAMSLLFLLNKKGLVHSVCSYTALVYGFSKEAMWKEVSQILGDMESAGFKPNRITYTVVIKYLCVESRFQEALSILAKMEKEACDPDMITYNIILRELSSRDSGGEINKLLSLLDQKGLCPDSYTFTALAGGLLKQGRLGGVNKLLLDVIMQGYSVDIAVYNIYLHSLCLKSEYREALCLISDMIGKGFTPNIISYNTILKGICLDGNCNDALEFLDTEVAKFGPDIVSYNTVLSEACKQGNSTMIQKILDRMEHQVIELNVVSMTCLIQHFCRIEKFMECLKLLQSMICYGPAPNERVFNVFISGLCKKQLLGMAYGILRDFKNSGSFPDTTTYNILTHAALRAGLHTLVAELFTDMYSLRLVPDDISYRTLISGVCKGWGIEVALELCHKMVVGGIKPTVDLYNIILKEMFRRRMSQDILLLLKDMLRNGCEPNNVSYAILKQVISGDAKNFSGTS